MNADGYFGETKMRTKLDGLKVRDIMVKDVFTVSLSQTWKDAARKMSSKNIHHLVVVDGQHMPVTVISVSDFLRFALSEDLSELHKSMEDTKPHGRLYSVRPDSPAFEAVNEMNVHHIESVAVLSEDGKLEGIVTASDLMNSLFFNEKFRD